MGLFENIKEYAAKRITPYTPVGNQEVGVSRLTSSPEDESREAIYPQWFFSSRLGQPRQVDTQKIRKLAQSAWTQMVLNTFKKQIYNTDWEIQTEDKDVDPKTREADIKKVMDFLHNINDNNQTIDDVNSEVITDIGEIDAGVWNMVYSNNSYAFGDLPLYDAWGRVIGSEQGLVLKPLGQRELIKVKAVDGSSMLKQVDIHKNLINYWQYSFKHPRQNPTRFEKDEIVYMLMNGKSYSVYGFSPVQAVQQVLELLIQGTRYNKDLYTNNAIPDLLVSMPKLPNDQLKKLKRAWNNQFKGRPHPIAFVNWAVENITKLAGSNRDLEWLSGQQWYFKLVFAVFGVSPTEAGFFENSNKSNDDGQERVTVRNAVKPYFKVFEQNITKRLITEILQKEDHGLLFRYTPKDHTLEKIEFEQDMQELDRDALTINEYRKKKGRDPVEWGNKPIAKPTMFGESDDPNKPDNNSNPKLDDLDPKQQKALKKELYKKEFEGFLNGRRTNSQSTIRRT